MKRETDMAKAEESKVHKLKTWPMFFQAVLEGSKPFELRKNDYVPNGLIPPTDGHGDYVHLIIDKDGYVTNWYQKPSFEDFFPDND